MIRILVVNIQNHGGGAETVLKNLRTATAAGNYGLQIDTLSKADFDQNALSANKNKLLGYLRFLLVLRHRGRGYDFVVSGVEGIPFLLCMIAFIGLKIPRLIMWLHCNFLDYLKFQNLKNRYAIRLSILFASNIICAAFIEASRLNKTGKNAIYLPNILNSRPLAITTAIPCGVLPNLVFIGSLASLKQPNKAVEVMQALLNERLLDFQLSIFGTGPLFKDLCKTIEKCQLGNCVQVHGFVSNPWQMVLPGSILLLPSLTEATPMVVLEALEKGCVVISNTYNGYEFFNEHGGLFVGISFADIADVVYAIKYVRSWDTTEYLMRRLKSETFVRNEFDNNNSINILHDYLVELK